VDLFISHVGNAVGQRFLQDQCKFNLTSGTRCANIILFSWSIQSMT